MGGIDFNVFISEDYIRRAFERFDVNGDGEISKEEMRILIQAEKGNSTYGSLDDAEVEKAMKQFDHDGDGKVAFEDFKQFMFKLFKRHQKE